MENKLSTVHEQEREREREREERERGREGGGEGHTEKQTNRQLTNDSSSSFEEHTNSIFTCNVIYLVNSTQCSPLLQGSQLAVILSS